MNTFEANRRFFLYLTILKLIIFLIRSLLELSSFFLGKLLNLCLIFKLLLDKILLLKS